MLSFSTIKNLSSNTDPAKLTKALLFLILTFNDFANVAKLRSINKEWKPLIEEPALWKFKIATELDCKEITIPNFVEDKKHETTAIARFYARKSAVKIFDKDNKRKLYNDLSNFGLNPSFNFHNLPCYAPFFLSKLKNEVALNLRVHYIIEAAAAGNISLLSKLLTLWSHDASWEDKAAIRHAISRVFLLGRHSALELFENMGPILQFTEILEYAVLSDNVTFLENVVNRQKVKDHLLSYDNYFHSEENLYKVNKVAEIAVRTHNPAIIHLIFSQHSKLFTFDKNKIYNLLAETGQFETLSNLTKDDTTYKIPVETPLDKIFRIVKKDFAYAESLLSREHIAYLTKEDILNHSADIADAMYFIYKSPSRDSIVNFIKRTNSQFGYGCSAIVFVKVLHHYTGDVNYLQWLFKDNLFNLAVPEYEDHYGSPKEIINRTVELNQQPSLKFLLNFYEVKANKEMLIKAVKHDSKEVRDWLAQQVHLMDVTQEELHEVVECETSTPEQIKWFLEKLKSQGNQLVIKPENFTKEKINPSVFTYLINEYNLTFSERQLKLYAANAPNLIRFSLYSNPKNYQGKEELVKQLINPKM